MSVSTDSAVRDDDVMTSSKPRSGGPSRRRSFTPAQKIAHLSDYEAACKLGDGGEFLRREGLYSSQMSEWRRQRDAGVLEGKKPGSKIGKLTAEQVEIARLRQALAKSDARLARTEAALEIMGKARMLLEELAESTDPKNKRGWS